MAVRGDHDVNYFSTTVVVAQAGTGWECLRTCCVLQIDLDDTVAKQ